MTCWSGSAQTVAVFRRSTPPYVRDPGALVADGETTPRPRTCNRLTARPEPSRLRRPARASVTIRAPWLSALALCPAPSPAPCRARRPAPPAIPATGRRSGHRRRPNPMYPKRASTSRMIRMITMSDISGSSLTMKRRQVARGQRTAGTPSCENTYRRQVPRRSAWETPMRRIVSQSNDRSERISTTPPLRSYSGI